MTTTTAAAPVTTPPAQRVTVPPSRPEPTLRGPRAVAMPDAALLARFDPHAAEQVTAWQDSHRRAILVQQAAEDAAPGGRDHAAALAATAAAVRQALTSGRDVDDDTHVEELAMFLQREASTRLARAVVETTKADVALDRLLTHLAAHERLREQVDAAVEAWVDATCQLVDSDAPGVVEQATQANTSQWRPLAGLLVWLDNPRAGYRLRPPRTTDARLAEALAMHATRHGQVVYDVPYSGAVTSGTPTPGGFEPSGRYDQDGRVLTHPTPPTTQAAIDAAPTPVETPPRRRWGRLSA